MAVRQYIGARYVPKFFENPNNTAEWLPNTIYEPLTIVTYGLNTYTSKKTVPASVGDPSNNPDYWVATGNYNAYISELSDKIDEIKEGFVTPLMFGAVGDGVNDDTQAVANALATGAPVNLIDKTYKISSLITLDNNTKIYNGSLIFSNAITTIKADGKNNIVFDKVNIETAVVIGTLANNRIDQFSLQFDNCTNVILRDCSFKCKDCRSVGFRFCDNCLVYHCVCTDIEGTGITFVACNFASMVLCEFDGRAQYDNSWHASDVYGKNDNCDNILIDSCYFHHHKGCGIQFTSTPGTWDITNARVINCVFEKWNDAGLKIDGVMSEVIIDGNIFDTNNYYGDAASAYPISLGGQSGIANNVTVKNNIFKNLSKGYVVAINIGGDVDKITVINNSVTGIGDNGCRVFRHENNHVKELTFSDNTLSHVQLFFTLPTNGYSTKSIIHFNNNVIKDVIISFGVVLGAQYIDFNNNYIGTNLTPSIRLYGDFARVENNHIVKETDYSGATYILRGPATINTLTFNGNYVDLSAGTKESNVSVTTSISYQLQS